MKSKKLTFRVSFLQCEITSDHASHSHYGSIDPIHEGGHVSVDVKHSVLCMNRELEELAGSPRVATINIYDIIYIIIYCHLGAAVVGSPTADKAGQNSIHCQGSPAVTLCNFFYRAFSV